MPKKCESCRHYFNDPALEFKYGVCGSEDVLGVMVGSAVAIDISAGRLICDTEGDGRFAFYEPIEPTAGAAFDISDVKCEIPATVEFVQITRMSSNSNPPPDWRRELNDQLHGRAATNSNGV